MLYFQKTNFGGVGIFAGKATTTHRHVGLVRYEMNIHEWVFSRRALTNQSIVLWTTFSKHL